MFFSSATMIGGALLLAQAGAVKVNPWASLLEGDVEVMHQTLLDSHPGAVDQQNAGFKQWLDAGYRQALDRVKTCDSFAGYRFGLEAYARGFKDGHLSIHTYLQSEWRAWPGFLIGRRDGKFVVRTDGPDGTLHDYDVKYTFGIAPLQQYLIELPCGRIQALGIAWDSRPKAQGGQRWFHLYPGQNVTHRDELHWTRLSQNWNYMCAECHSTGVRKHYDAKSRTFNTAYAEVNVACEACHGPGSNHVAWARKEGDWQRLDGGTKGLALALDDRRNVT